MTIITPPAPDAWQVDGRDRSLIITSRELALGALRDGTATLSTVHDYLRRNFLGSLDETDMRTGIAEAIRILTAENGGKFGGASRSKARGPVRTAQDTGKPENAP
jgi:hypothetical protein